MLTIRPHQFAILSEAGDRRFIPRAARYLSLRYAALVEDLPDEVVHDMVRGGVARARQYGIQHESALIAFLELMFAIAPNFDEHAAIAAMLTDPKVPADERIDRLVSRTTFETWMDVCRDYDPFAWDVEFVRAQELLERRGDIRVG